MPQTKGDEITIKNESGRVYVSGLNFIETTYFQELLKQHYTPEDAVREIDNLRKIAKKHGL